MEEFIEKIQNRREIKELKKLFDPSAIPERVADPQEDRLVSIRGQLRVALGNGIKSLRDKQDLSQKSPFDLAERFGLDRIVDHIDHEAKFIASHVSILYWYAGLHERVDDPDRVADIPPTLEHIYTQMMPVIHAAAVRIQRWAYIMLSNDAINDPDPPDSSDNFRLKLVIDWCFLSAEMIKIIADYAALYYAALNDDQ